MLAYVETVQSKEKEIGCDVLTHQKWCAAASSFTPCFDLIHLCFGCVGVERITSIEFYLRSHPDLRAPLLGERILPNTHSNSNSKQTESCPPIILWSLYCIHHELLSAWGLQYGCGAGELRHIAAFPSPFTIETPLSLL